MAHDSAEGMSPGLGPTRGGLASMAQVADEILEPDATPETPTGTGSPQGVAGPRATIVRLGRGFYCVERALARGGPARGSLNSQGSRRGIWETAMG